MSRLQTRSGWAPWLAAVALAAFIPLAAQADSYRVLYSFAGGNDGFLPNGPLARDKAGDFYGVTEIGGSAGAGTIFKLAPDGTHTVLYSFTGGADGDVPSGGPIYDRPSGALYGLTQDGGAVGDGTIYKLAADGTLTVLHNFNGTDGEFPAGRLVRDENGDLFGVATYGGSDHGTVFKLAPDGTFTVLHTFTGGSDGGNPIARLSNGQGGELYGTTQAGGAYGYGTVFRLAPDGTLTTLHSFNPAAEGGDPVGGLVRDKSGNLYGTASLGGAGGDGVVFKLAPDGTYTVLHAFTGGADGNSPQGDLMRIGKNLYGTTVYGGGPDCGATGCGTVFRIAPDGTETILHSFTGPPGDGAHPYAPVKGRHGDLRGVTENGGANDKGAVYTLGTP